MREIIDFLETLQSFAILPAVVLHFFSGIRKDTTSAIIVWLSLVSIAVDTFKGRPALLFLVDTGLLILWIHIYNINKPKGSKQHYDEKD